MAARAPCKIFVIFKKRVVRYFFTKIYFLCLNKIILIDKFFETEQNNISKKIYFPK